MAIEEELLNKLMLYAEGKEVSDEFLTKLEANPELQAELAKLKSDLFFMENVDDSSMFRAPKERKLSFSLSEGINRIIENIGFTQLTLQTARGDEVAREKTLCAENLEVEFAKDGGFTITAYDVENSFVVEKEGKDILRSSKRSERICSPLLQKGSYTVSVDERVFHISAED